MRKTLEKTRFYSYKYGTLCKGCRQCVQGKKLVLFITGLCPLDCFYCPLSDNRKDKDIIWANEMPIATNDRWMLKKIKKEAQMCNATGTGITGGDPLVVMDRTIKVIRYLKKLNHHIHLYTPLKLVSKERLKKLYDAGLDEIRFHPDLYDDSLWEKLSLAKAYKWKVGIEIPAIKGSRAKELIRFAKGKIDFLNINELEISDNNSNNLLKLGFVPKDSISYAIKGSDSFAKSCLRYAKTLNIPTHYCTSRLKDKVQMANRLKLRARNTKSKFDMITKDNLLMKGIIYFLDAKERLHIITTLKKLKIPFEIEKKKSNISASRSTIKTISKTTDKKTKKSSSKDQTKNTSQIIVHPRYIEQYYDDLPYKMAFLEYYPTWDKLEVELTIVKDNKNKKYEK